MREGTETQPSSGPVVRFRVLIALGVALVAAVLIGGVAFELVRGRRVIVRAEEAARAAVAAGRFDEARAPLSLWLAAQPRSAEAQAVKAEWALAGGDLAEVSRALNTARDLGCPAELLDRVDALVKTRLGRFAEAAPILVRLRNASDRPDPTVDEALARIFLESYRMTLAEAVLLRWIKDAPGDARPYLWLTEIDQRFDRDQLLEPHYRAALRLDPTLRRARLGLAEVLRSHHRLEESFAEFTAYVAQHPDDPAGHTGLGGVAREQDQPTIAARHLDRALELASDDPRALKERGILDLRLNDPAAAVLRLTRAIQADPLDSEILYNRSLALKRLGRTAEAAADVQALERLRKEQAEVVAIRQRVVDNANDPEARCEIARWMFRHGREDEGLRWAQSVLDIQPRHPAANRLLADHFDRKGEPGRANYHRLIADSGR